MLQVGVEAGADDLVLQGQVGVVGRVNDVVFGVQAWFRVGNLVLRIGVGGADGDLDGVQNGAGADDLVLRSQVGEGADSVVIWVLGGAVDLEVLVGVQLGRAASTDLPAADASVS